MKKKKNKIVLFIICIVACIILVVVGVTLLKNNKEDWAADDIYIYNSNGYMAFRSDETIKIKILLCSLHRNGKNPAEKYEKIYFKTETGDRYQSSFDNKAKNTMFHSGKVYTESILEFPLEGSFIAGERLNFTSMILQTSEGAERELEFGKIVIEILEDSSEADDIMILASSVYKGRLTSYGCNIENQMSSDVRIQDIYFGENIRYTFNEIVIPASDTADLKVEINEPDEYLQTPSFYVLRPKLTAVMEDGKNIVCSTDTIVYSGDVPDKELRKYLLDFQNVK